MLAALVARVLARSRPNYGDGAFAPYMNPRGDLNIVQGMLPKVESGRMGNKWTCVIDTAEAFTYVNAWPTTRAELVLFNADPVLSYVIDSAFMVDITTAAAAQSKTLLGQIAQPGIAAPTNNAGPLIFSRSGRAGYGGAAKRAVANTAFALANKWEILASKDDGNTASIGAAVLAELSGGWIIPPGGALCLAGLASTAAGTALIGVTWDEYLLPVIG